MKMTKRILAFVLCFAMIVGMMPMIALRADAAGVLVDAAIFGSDVHGNPSTVTSIFNGIKSADSTFNPTTATFVGDTQCAASSVTSAAQSVYSNVQCYYAYGNHDSEGNYGIADVTGLLYGDSTTNYYIYTISESSMGSSNPDTTGFTSTVSGLDKTKPLFIVSHMPLHQRRNDNKGAAAWYNAISAAAESMDIFFFWAHNHTGDNTVDQAAYYVAKNGSETMSIQGGSTVTPNFTYANAGYIAPPNSAARVNVATAVRIYDDSVNLTVYNASGELSGTYAVNETVTRQFASTDSGSTEETTAPTEETTAPTEETKTIKNVVLNDGTSGTYVVGDPGILFNLVVNYSDGSSEIVTQDVCVIESVEDALTGEAVDYATAMQTPGEYAATVSYQGFLCGSKVYFTVSASGDSNYDLLNLIINGAEVTADVKNVTADETVVAAMGTLEGIDEFVAYDITATLAEGETATVSIPVPAEWAQGELSVYYITDEGAVSDETFQVTYADGYATFTVTHFSTYTVTVTLPDGTDIETEGESAVVEGTSTPKEVWVKVDAPVDGGEYLIVSTGTSGTNGYIMGNSTAVTPTSGELTVNGTTGTYTYLETASGTLWTASGSGTSWSFANGSSYLGHTQTDGESYVIGGTYNNSLNTAATSAETWTYSNNELYMNLSTGWGLSTGSDDFYLTGGSSWSISTSSANVYFYQKVTASVGTVGHTYTAEGIDVTNAVALEGQTVTLSSKLWDTPEGGTASEITTLTPTYEVVTTKGNPAVISKIENGVATLSGVAGTAVVKVTYTNGTLTAWDEFVVTAVAPTFDFAIAEGETTVKIGATLTLTANPTMNGATTDLGSTVTWTSSDEAVATVDANGVVTGVAAGDTTITAEWTDPTGVKHTDTVTVEVVDAVYTLNIDQGDSVVHKGVQNGQTLALTATVTRDEAAVENPTLTWSVVSGNNIATIDASTGTLTFTGEEGDVKVRVTYQVNETMTLEDYITVHVNKSTAITPEESTTDFPRWPNEGAVRYDKTAQAVGNFSNTGVAQLELSLAGIPQKTGGAVDVVLMLDMTGSMDDTEMAAAEAAAKVFADQIIKNADGTFNDSRLAVYAFNSGSSSPYELWAMSAVTADTYDDLTTAIESASEKKVSGGTPYDEALSQCRTVLQNTKTAGHQQFCVFVSDGAPTAFEYITGGTSPDYTHTGWSHSGSGSPSDSAVSALTSYTEYYSTMMKEVDGVTVYTVGTGLTTTSNANALAILENIASDESKAYVVASASDTTGISNAFKAIAAEINQAATNITVTDKITEEYEMVFDWPDAVTEANKVAGQEFYIEVVNYDLDATSHERNGSYDVLLRVYLTENADGTLALSKLVKIDDVTSSSAGTTTTLTTTPAYTAVSEGDKGYFNLVDGKYVYVADGTGAYNMTEGATVSGTSDTVELHTPYFSYTAADKIIKWHVSETAENSEIALRYFLYLTGSLESVAAKLEEGDEGYVAPGTYPTNDYATLEYVNYKNNECLQYFPEPQLTWNGAQVSYVFYLVNSNGVPVNTAGREVTFAEAVFVTKIYTEAVVWNEDEGKTSLDATKIADDLLPDDYTLYDPDTQYEIHVYQDESDNDLGNRFIITAGDGTTIVYNTKAGIKYSTAGTYTKDNVDNNFDFANTTVAFAVVWERKLVEDTVVIDFGLPVDINVTTNDFVYNSINAIGTNTPNADINDGLYTESALSTKINESTGMSEILTLTGGHTAQIMNENVIRFTPGNMELNAPIKFNYETTTEYYEDSAVKTGYLYSTVTVIPATTVYYEDSFLTLESYTVTYNDDGTSSSTKQNPSAWTQEGTTLGATQDQDRPGESQISADLDADNNYGYDDAYETVATHSMGSAAKINVNANVRGEATFTFYGTGFDVISMTSNTTGTLIVQLFNGSSASGSAAKSLIVDTYYGYTQNEKGEWEVSVNTPNALYQVPVMKMSGLTYGQYTVKIIAGYNSYFDNVDGSADYDLYLDAIRIYDPTGNKNTDANNAYVADGEGWPQYIELRNNIISAEGVTIDDEGKVTFPAETAITKGAIFIDSNDATTSIVDYVSYGPNNELYLAAGQSVSFALDRTNASIIADVQIAMKLGNGTSVSYEMYNAASDGTKSNTITGTLTTATDLYYSIKDLASGTIVISNTSGGILSITNIKVTYTQDPNGTGAASEDDETNGTMATSLYMDEEVATAAVMSLRSMPVYEPEETEPTEPETEPTEPEETEPTEPETEPTEPETEPTEPETEPTEPETEPTEPETEPSEPSEEEKVEEIVKEVGKIIKKLFGWLFG